MPTVLTVTEFADRASTVIPPSVAFTVAAPMRATTVSLISASLRDPPNDPAKMPTDPDPAPSFELIVWRSVARTVIDLAVTDPESISAVTLFCTRTGA